MARCSKSAAAKQISERILFIFKDGRVQDIRFRTCKCPYNGLCILKQALSFLLLVYQSCETQKLIMEEKYYDKEYQYVFPEKSGNNYKVKLIL